MKEEFLHHIWQYQLWNTLDLKTINSDIIEVKKVGDHNTNSGPDFLNTQLKIANFLWAGNVEIHKKSSDWNRHNHQKDTAYNNVILHVVFLHDKIIYLQPVFLLKK